MHKNTRPVLGDKPLIASQRAEKYAETLDAKLRSYEAVDEATGISARRARRLDAFAEKIFESNTKRPRGRIGSIADNSRRDQMERSFAGLARDAGGGAGPGGRNVPPSTAAATPATAPVRRTQQERRDAVAARRKMLGAFHTGKVHNDAHITPYSHIPTFRAPIHPHPNTVTLPVASLSCKLFPSLTPTKDNCLLV